MNKLAIPVSITGLKIIKTSTSFAVISDPLTLKDIDGFSFGNERQLDCYSFTTTPSDIRDFLTSSSFMKSLFVSIDEILPDWLRFSQLGTEVFRLHDLNTELLNGRELLNGPCRGAPVYENRLYAVLKYGSRFSVSLYGDERTAPGAASSNEQFCLIVDICQSHGSSLFLLIPKESGVIFSKFKFIDSIRQKYGIDVRISGIGLSLINDIHVTNAGKTHKLWNGDGYFTYQ